jgi:hypothetical protein
MTTYLKIVLELYYNRVSNRRVQCNLSNPTHQVTREMCRIVQDVGLLRFYLKLTEILWDHEYLLENSGVGFTVLTIIKVCFCPQKRMSPPCPTNCSQR